MKKLWNKIKAHFSGWPEGAEERIVEKKKKLLNNQLKKVRHEKQRNQKV